MASVKRHGKIILYTGCMTSGKTSSMLTDMQRYFIAKKRCLIIKWDGDNRFGEGATSVVSHSGLTSKDIECRAVTSAVLNKLTSEGSLYGYDVIGIDEGQFFDNIDRVAIDLSNHGVQVLISALNGTFDRKLFGNIYKLFPYLTSCIWKNAICVECGSEYGCYSYTAVKHDGDILIGGTDIYKALCRVCYDKLV